MSRPPLSPHFPFRFPVTAIASITHRISGVALVGAVGLGLGLLTLAKGSPQGYETAAAALDHWLGAGLLWLSLVGLGYHLCSAVRHLCQDFGWAVGPRSGKLSAWAVFAATAALALLLAAALFGPGMAG